MSSGPWSVEEMNALLDIWGADSIQSQLDGITRNKTVHQQVASMLSRDHNWALCTNRHKFKFVVRTWLKWIDPVSYEVDWGVRSMWIESGCNCSTCSFTCILIGGVGGVKFLGILSATHLCLSKPFFKNFSFIWFFVVSDDLQCGDSFCTNTSKISQPSLLWDPDPMVRISEM